MKFTNGNLVEVLRREHDPCGSWFPASIISTDGDNFIVRFKSLVNPEGKKVVEKVHERDVRPPPSNVTGQTWTVGDVAEVFDAQCWRVGKVAKVLQKKNGVVMRFFGSIQLKEFDVSNLRIRQVWCDNEWKMIGKVIQEKQFPKNYRPNNSDFAQGLPSRTPSELRCRDLDMKEKIGEWHLKHQTDHTRSCLPLRTVRKSYAPRYEENSRDVVTGGRRKKRKRSRGRNEPSKRKIPSFKQVDDTSCSHIGVEEKFIPQSTETDNILNNATPHWLDDSCRPLWSAEDSNQCSVASCSTNYIPDYPVLISHKPLENLPENSDAESLFPSMGGKGSLPLSPIQKLEVDIHELELRAYKSTMEAMYALGPLSWDQESLLTNLRLSLHISDEEHLFQLRHLLSTQVL
ncbi:hypothetical protein SLE2022_245680 [Rubroshorea leprosula]